MTKTYLDWKIEMIEKEMREIKTDIKEILSNFQKLDERYAKKEEINYLHKKWKEYVSKSLLRWIIIVFALVLATSFGIDSIRILSLLWL